MQVWPSICEKCSYYLYVYWSLFCLPSNHTNPFPKFQPKTKKENMGFCHPPKTHKNNTFKLGDPTLQVLSLVEASKAFCYAHQLFFPFVLLWVKNYAFAFAFVLLWVKNYAFAFAFVLLWVKNYEFVVRLFFCLCISAVMSEKICFCCVWLFFCVCIHALMSEKLCICCMALFFWQRTSVYLVLTTRAINLIIVLWEGPASM